MLAAAMGAMSGSGGASTSDETSSTANIGARYGNSINMGTTGVSSNTLVLIVGVVALAFVLASKKGGK